MQIHPDPDISVITRLLHDNDLPPEDLQGEHNVRFFACETASGWAIGGVEAYDGVGLLRSLAVDAAARSQGLATALVRHVEAYAVEHGISHMYLLTNTAESFFERLGYRRLPREVAPPAVRATREFTSLCPDDAAFMGKSLTQGTESR